MRVFRPQFRWRSVTRRLGVVLTLCAYLAASADLPLPAAPRKDTGEAYPCQDHACGCRSAEDCWRHCCCLSVEERWAWARAHHVTPPDYAERPAVTGWRTVPLRQQAQEQASAATPACCSPQKARSESCCESNQPGTCCSEHPAPASNSQSLSGFSALRCQGLATLWVSTGAISLPPPLPTVLSSPPVQVRVVEKPHLPELISYPPPSPPPRLRSAL